jgi:HEAT repeat protein
LADMVDPSCMPALIKLLTDPESDIRWIAAEGLIRLGPSSLRDVLRLLIEKPKSIDTREAVHHVLRKLAAENRVIQELVAPVLDVLGETDPASSLPPRAEQALKRIESLQLG